MRQGCAIGGRNGGVMFNDRLDYFVLAYESPNFSAAAAHVPMSPQGFSKAMRNLEKELGVTLFFVDASGQRHPTPYAERFYDYVTNVRRERLLLQHSFEQMASAGVMELRVASSLGIAGLIGRDLKDEFQKQCPGVRLSLIEMADEDCERFVSKGFYSCGLLVSPARGDLTFREFFATNVCLWVHRSNPLFSCGELELEDLVGQTVAMPGRGFKCYKRLVERMEDAGLEMPEVIERSEIIWIYEEASRGNALGFCLPYMKSMASFSHGDNVAAIPVNGSRWGFGVVYDRVPAEGSYEAAFIQCVETCSRRLVRWARWQSFNASSASRFRLTPLHRIRRMGSRHLLRGIRQVLHNMPCDPSRSRQTGDIRF